MAEAPQARGPHPLVELTRVRVLEFVREPEAVFWVFVFPVLLALALGIAFRTQPPAPAQVVLTDDAAAALPTAALALEPGLAVRVEAEPVARALLARGVVDVVVAGGPEELVYAYDPSRPEGRSARLAADDALQRLLGRRPAAAVREATVRAAGARYIDFLIPGLIGMNLMGSGMWGLGFSVVVQRTRKLLKRFAVTPMHRSQFLLSFALSRLVFLVLEVGAIVGFGWLLFGVAVHGSLAALAVVSLVGALCFAGLGLLVAARPQTVEGVSGWMNAVMLPMWLLSGSFFSSERFPDALQPLIQALPLTALNDALRAVMNDGAPLASTWSELGLMTVWGIASFVVALRIFRWQ